MALQGSGQISFSDIINEFGSPSPAALGSYRVSQTIGELANLPLDNGVPQSGTISFSDFYSKKLNIVVNYHSGGTEYQQDARDMYDANGITIVGGFISVNNKPAAGSGAKVMIHVDNTIGSTHNAGANRCALTTGSWSNTTLQIDLGSTARISGAGGNGGHGSEGSGRGEDGFDGTSGLGVQYSPTTINSVGGSIISAGFGGGGGGGGGHEQDKNSERTASGAGGGGGAGVPAGAGGVRGEGGTRGGPGTSGTADTAGEGGSGSNNGNEAYGGAGGEGGSNGEAANDGNIGQGGESSRSDGGEGGASGAAIRRTNNSISISINGPVDIRGAYNPAPTGVSEN